MLKEVDLSPAETTHAEEMAALDAFADVHGEVVRKIEAGTATQIDMKLLRGKAEDLERTDNEMIAEYGQRAMAHIELAFQAMREPDGRRKRRMVEKMRRKSGNLSKFIAKVADEAQAEATK